MALNAWLSGFAEIAPERKTVCDLHSGGSPYAGTLRRRRGHGATDRLTARAHGKPGGGCLTVRQQIHGPAGFDVDQHSPVDAALAHRVLVDPHRPR
jgi:hypothetical protein